MTPPDVPKKNIDPCGSTLASRDNNSTQSKNAYRKAQ